MEIAICALAGKLISLYMIYRLGKFIYKKITAKKVEA